MAYSTQSLDKASGAKAFSVVQLSDLHLDEQVDDLIKLDSLLADLRQCYLAIDLLVVTGDLVKTLDHAHYEQIFARLERFGVPYICVAGNHDVTQELDSHLPFEQRRHIAMPRHPQLLDRHAVTTPHWQLLFCDSSVPGEVYGHFSEATLTWLADQLATAQKPCIMFCHHHVLPVHSTWLDEHIAQNYFKLWAIIEQFPQTLTAIFTGHVHQEQNLLYKNVAVYTVPSLSEQFLPLSTEFATDNEAKIGYRWITLYNNGQLATGVKRLDTIAPL